MAIKSSNSRYHLTPTKVDDLVSPGRFRFETWRVPNIDMTEYSMYVITEADLKRIDLIAFRTLGDDRLWWAIALVNNIANPLEDLEIGSALRIPTTSAILKALAQQESTI